MIVEKNRWLIKTKINVGQFFGVASDEVFIEMREPDTLQYVGIKTKWAEAKGDKDKMLMIVADIIDTVIIDHNFFHEANKKLTSKEVKTEVMDRIELFAYVVGEYAEKVLFTSTTAKTQGKEETTEEAKPD